jgi:hypothetical protein
MRESGQKPVKAGDPCHKALSGASTERLCFGGPELRPWRACILPVPGRSDRSFARSAPAAP